MPEDDRPTESILPYDVLVDDWLDAVDRAKERERKKADKKEVGMKMYG